MTATSQFPPAFGQEFVKRLYQLSCQEENCRQAKPSYEAALHSSHSPVDEMRQIGVSHSERDLVVLVGSSLGVSGYKLLEKLERTNKSIVVSYGEEKGKLYEKAMQFLHIYQNMEGENPETMREYVARYGQKGILKKLVDYYGSFFDIFKVGKVSTADHIDIQAYIEAGVRPPADFQNPRVIADVVDFLLHQYEEKKHQQVKNDHVQLPAPTPANGAWMTWMLGYAARFYYSSDIEDKTIGNLSFPHFMHVITGADPQFVHVASFAALGGEDELLKISGCQEQDLAIAKALESIVAGNYDLEPPGEIQNLALHAGIYDQAMEDNHLELEELALIEEYLRCVEGIRHPSALSILLQTSPVKDPAYIHKPRRTRQATPFLGIPLNKLPSNAPPLPVEAISAAVIQRPQEKTALPLQIVLDYLRG